MRSICGVILPSPARLSTALVFPRTHTDDREALDERDVDRDLGNSPGDEAHHQQLAAEGYAARALVEDIAPNRVEHEIAQAAIG